jgi:hypothetical protein
MGRIALVPKAVEKEIRDKYPNWKHMLSPAGTVYNEYCLLQR